MNAIGKREGQGCAFRFLNRRGEPYEWTDEVPEDDPEFQGLLDKAEDTAVYPDVSAELPGVALEEHERNFQTITEEPEPDFWDLAEAALHNAGIDTDDTLRRAHLENAPRGPAAIEAKDDEIVYEIMFDLPDAGLQPTVGNPAVVLGNNRNDNTSGVIPVDTATNGQHYPTQACRSAIGTQPYNTYAPRTTFLQLGPARAHRSVLEANRLARMTKEERLLATTATMSEPFVDAMMHRVDKVMCTTLQEELGVMAYLFCDSVQFEARFAEICDTRGESRVEGDDAAPHHGHVDSYGCGQAVARTKDESTILAALSQGETNGRHLGEGMHKRGASAGIYSEGGRGVAYCVNRIDVLYRDDSSQGRKEGEVLRYPQHIRQHGCGRGCHNGTEGRTCRHDDPD